MFEGTYFDVVAEQDKRFTMTPAQVAIHVTDQIVEYGDNPESEDKK
jgi:hypothetical protein